MDRYDGLIYLPIDEDEDHSEERFDRLRRTIEEHRAEANAFLLAGELSEERCLDHWIDTVTGRDPRTRTDSFFSSGISTLSSSSLLGPSPLKILD